MQDILDWDLVAVGGGFAGLVAAVRGAELGLRAGVLEQGGEPLYACNSRYAGGVMHVSYNDPKAPPQQLLAAIEQITAGYADPALAAAVAANAARAVDWLRDQGARFVSEGTSGWRQWIMAPPRPSVTGMQWKGHGSDVTLQVLEARLGERGGRLDRATVARELVLEAGRCVGVRARRGAAELVYRARAVVLADGGFQGNDAMLGRNVTPAPAKVKQRGAGTGRGSGVQIAQQAGAAITALDAFYGHLLVRDAMHNDEVWPYPQIDELAAAGVVVDSRGKRIGDEGLGGVYLANVVARQADPLQTSAVFDEAIWQQQGKAAAIPPNPRLPAAGGTLYTADTLAALAEKAGIDAAGLEATVRAYNEALRAGTLQALDPARTSRRRAPAPIVTAPFHAVPLCAGVTYTMGGIAIDANARVLNAERAPMPGLYAAGSSIGGLEGGPAVGYVGGLMKAVVFGLLAAEHIAASRAVA